jgi:uncharacterized protein YgbK (DUF1537 family)
VSQLRLSFYGDDFTGSTDAMESLALSGVKTILFTSPPTRAQLDRYPDLQAFGVAGMTRSEPADEMEKTLRPAFQTLRDLGAPIVHYKVCSTFDSSPQIGSIGRVIEIGMEEFHAKFVPVLVGAPSLGRYCVFGNLFARCGTESEPFRLDRHPSMSRHPITPMGEADLCLHLAKQTKRKIGLFDVLAIEAADAQGRFERLGRECEIGLIDILYESQLAPVGTLLAQCDKPLFVVGSSGVESALAAHWRTAPAAFGPVMPAGKVLVICGSCSPVTAGQVAAAERLGFGSTSFDHPDARDEATRMLRQGHGAIIHTFKARKKPDFDATLCRLARDVLEATRVHRVIVAGGDTAGAVARALGIESLEMIGELTRGSPLCRASAPGSPAHGVEFTFKGGQIGPVDFFEMVRTGTTHA